MGRFCNTTSWVHFLFFYIFQILISPGGQYPAVQVDQREEQGQAGAGQSLLVKCVKGCTTLFLWMIPVVGTPQKQRIFQRQKMLKMHKIFYTNCHQTGR